MRSPRATAAICPLSLVAGALACNPGPATAPVIEATPVTVSLPPPAPVTAEPVDPAPPPTSASSSVAEPAATPPNGRPRLPPRRPADMVFRFQRTVVPHGAPIRHEGIELHGPATPCPATSGPRTDPVLPCRQVSEATLDLIFRELKARRFDSIATAPRNSSPHYGTRALTVVWGSNVCDLVDSALSGPQGSGAKAFGDLVDLVVAARP